jgi:tetratricopeptide (TPR) repeat protein
MLATMSIFVEGWTVEAAVHVSGLTEDRTLDLLDSLAGHSLLSVAATDVGPRFRMLAAIRELAAERLAAGADLADVERRHAEYFGALVEDADWPAERQAEWAERLRTEEGNLRVAIRWFLAHDIAPLPHIFLVLWLFWQMRDGLAEGRGWIRELLARADALDDRAQAELWLISAVTAVEVGDDEGAQAAVDRIQRLEGRIGDPYLESVAQLARSWWLPTADDFEGALKAASTALDGFRRQDEPFRAWAALSVGVLEMVLGRHDAALEYLTEAEELGGQFGNRWLESTARTQLASLAVSAGDLHEARAQLVKSLDASEDTEPTIQTVSFALVADARLALAEGDARRAAMAMGAADGLLQRAGLRAWPSMRRGEAELLTRVAQEIDPEVFKDALAAGSELSQSEAVALVCGDRLMEV